MPKRGVFIFFTSETAIYSLPLGGFLLYYIFVELFL